MVAGARTFSLEDTFLEPQILNPPPTRHALLVVLLTLAAVLHLGTAGWGDLYDGVEGQFAGGERDRQTDIGAVSRPGCFIFVRAAPLFWVGW